MVGDGAATLVARAFAAAGAIPPPDALQRFLSIYTARPLRFTRPYAGIETLLVEASRRATLAVLTNKPLAATQSILDGLGLAPYFEDRVRGGDGPLPRKPDPAGLLDLTRGAVDPAATLMVGDSPVDLQTARAAGIRCCIARYGFGFARFETGRFGAADYLIDHPLELQSLLL
jgi:phosphoglycolate phosphatase